MRRLPTSADVARAAGVSRSTVSYVLNATPGARVAEATRKRVLATADELGYVPNMAAADLRRGTSRIILTVIERRRAAHVITEFMSSIADELNASGFTMLTLQVSGEVTGEDARSLATLRPAVVFSVGTHFSAEARKVFKRSEVVLIGEYEADVRWFFDQGQIAVAGAQALLERGRTGILQILPDDPSLAEFTAPRVAAFADVTGPLGLGTVHLPLGPELAAFVQELPKTRPTCDGLVVHNDEYAALVVGALLDARIDVPARMSVVGVDNTAWGAWMRPALSTLSIASSTFVASIAGAVMATLSGEQGRELRVDTAVSVVHRQTT